MKTKYKVIIGVVAVLWVLAFFTNDKDTDVADAESTQMGISTEQETEPQTEQIETEFNVEDLTEEEYKEMCVEIYDDYDTKFQETLQVGQRVKLYAHLEECVVFSDTNVFHDTEYTMKDCHNIYFVCRVQDKESSLEFIPGFNETIEIYFPKAGTVSCYDFQEGQTVLLYGEVFNVMEYSGVFIIPRYMEVVE